jgi:uncharacterized damage-inducible protein DinB
MTTATSNVLNEVEIFRLSMQVTDQVLKMNLKDITHEESLIAPQPAGNCLNWVVGHLVCIYNEMLPLLDQAPLAERDKLQRYARGTAPIQNATEAMQFGELQTLWQQTIARVEDGLANLTPEQLDSLAPSSPTNNPKETVRSLLTVISFHQAYHAGQTGTLRRIIGKPGAIA